MKREPSKEDIEEVWNFVKDDFLREDGLPDWDKLKEIIYNFNFIESQVSEVYRTVTGDKISKAIYHARDVISAYEEEINKLFIERPRYIDLDFVECEDWVIWALNAEDNNEKITEDEKLIAQYHSALFNYIENNKLILEKMEEIKKAKNIKDAKKIAEQVIKDNI